jgi:hypothetical protein
MTRDEWKAVLAAEPATPAQRGAIMREFGRLGFGEADRGERLAISAAIVGLDTLGSVRDLTMGEAGRLVRALLAASDRGELPAPESPAAAGSSDAETRPAARVGLAELIKAIAVALAVPFAPAAAGARMSELDGRARPGLCGPEGRS